MSEHVHHQNLLLEDEQSRIRALDANCSFIVEAPAGAGKTELLTQRFLRLLQTVQAPEEVIAITFTNKAASEMRARILDSLQDAADNKSIDKPHKQQTRELALTALQHAQQLQWRLLENPSRLRIYTIDSLSSHLARQMPLMSRFGAQPGVCEDAAVFYEEAAARTLELLDDAARGEVVQAALRYFDNDAYRLTQLLANMLARRDQWLNYTHDGNAAEVAETALARVIVQDMAEAAQYLTQALQQELMPIARYAACHVEPGDSIAALADWQMPVAADIEDLPRWRALCDLLLTGGATLRKTINTKQGLPATPEAKPYKAKIIGILEELRAVTGAESALARIRLLPDAEHGDEVWQIIATLVRLLRISVAELWLVFQSRGEVDFVEIAQRALMALEDESGAPTDIALRLDYRIQHLLVDEFQDTSPTQVKLLTHLTQGWMPGDGRTLFLVGDPMQSIYRFRKANVGLFLRVANEGINQLPLTRLRLWRNNRSCPPVIDWINAAFEVVFPKQDSVPRGAISYRPFVATKQDETASGVHVHALISNHKTSNQKDAQESEEWEAGEDETGGLNEAVDDVRQREASLIINIIQQTRKHNPGHKIAVLVRARSHLHALVTEIRRKHPTLSFQAVEIEELANRQIVQDLLSLTCALCHRADRVNWLAILRAPWCGLTLKDLFELAGNDRQNTVYQLMHDDSRLQQMTEDGRKRLLHVREVVDEALQQRGRQPVSRWVHAAWLMLGGADCLWEQGDVRDVQAFFQRIAELEAGNQFSAEQLAIEVKKLYAAPDAKADDKLQFMTIHKSKGLEFDTVILPGLDRKTGGDEQPLLLWEEVAQEHASRDSGETDLVVAPFIPASANKQKIPSAYSYLKVLEKERAQHEDARVLYVAATRAERCLHLLGAAKLNDKSEPQAPKNTFLELLWPQVAEAFSAASQQPGEASVRTENSLSLADFVPKLVRLAEPNVPEILRHRPLPHTDQQAEKVDDADSNQDNEPFFSAGLDADTGTLAHRYLELIARQGLARWPVSRVVTLKPAMQRWLMQRSYNDDEAEQGASRAAALLQATLASEQGQWVLLQREDANAELAIASEIEQNIKTQVLDRTFIEHGVRWIIDYKTTQLDQAISDSALSTQAETHQEQLERYAALFKDEGLPIKRAIFFMSLGRLSVLP